MPDPTLTPDQIRDLRESAERLSEPNRRQPHFLGRLSGGPLDGLTLPLSPSLGREAVLSFVVVGTVGPWQVLYARTGPATFEFREIYTGGGK